MIHVIATIELHPECRDQFLEEFQKIVPLVHAERSRVRDRKGPCRPAPGVWRSCRCVFKGWLRQFMCDKILFSYKLHKGYSTQNIESRLGGKTLSPGYS